MNETLETIARRITDLSAAVDQRFDGVDRRLDKVDQRLDIVDQRLDKVDQRLDKHDQRFDTIDEQWKTTDQQFKTIDFRFKTIDQQFAETRAQLGMQLEALDHKIGLIYDVVIAQQFKSRLDDHEVRLLALESQKPQDR